jgi:hypothetical protein
MLRKVVVYGGTGYVGSKIVEVIIENLIISLNDVVCLHHLMMFSIHFIEARSGGGSRHCRCLLFSRRLYLSHFRYISVIVSRTGAPPLHLQTQVRNSQIYRNNFIVSFPHSIALIYIVICKTDILLIVQSLRLLSLNL